MSYPPGNFDVLIFIYVFFTSLKILCLRGIVLSQQGIIFRVQIQIFLHCQQKDVLLGKSKLSPTISFFVVK